MADFCMPALGADMESGVLAEWLVKPGDTVARGQIVAVVETQKGAVEVEIWEPGVIEALLVEPGTEVAVGGPLAKLRSTDSVGSRVQDSPAATQSRSAVAPAPRAHEAPSPLEAMRRADELGIDLGQIAGSARAGIVTLEDVERAASGNKSATGIEKPDKQSAMRQAIATAMARSKREIPHYYLGTTIDLSRALDWLAQANLERPVRERILPVAVLAKSVAMALLEVPELNGFWRENAFVPVQSVHLGMAIALRGGGLVAPAIHDAHTRSVADIMAALSDLVARARTGTLRSSELTDATVTMTSLGDQGVETVYGVVNATLSADHRASAGHRGALFLAALDRILQQPEKLS